MVEIQVSTLPGMKMSRLPTGFSLQDNLENLSNGEKQMTIMAKPLSGASPTEAEIWKATPVAKNRSKCKQAANAYCKSN